MNIYCSYREFVGRLELTCLNVLLADLRFTSGSLLPIDRLAHSRNLPASSWHDPSRLCIRFSSRQSPRSVQYSRIGDAAARGPLASSDPFRFKHSHCYPICRDGFLEHASTGGIARLELLSLQPVQCQGCRLHPLQRGRLPPDALQSAQGEAVSFACL